MLKELCHEMYRYSNSGNYPHRLRVVPHFSSGIVERSWKSPHARKARRGGEREKWKLVSGFSFACNKYPPQFTDDKSNDSSIREGIPLDALNWFGRGYELHTPKSVGREGSKAWALSVVPHFSLSPLRLAFLVWGDFHARSTIPEEKLGTTRSPELSSN